MKTPNPTTETNPLGRFLVLVLLVVLLTGGLLYFFYSYPHRGIGTLQPIFFSHRIHAGVKEISCRFCHPYVERSHNPGIPEMSKCFYCHQYIIPRHPQIVRERWHLETRVPVPWVKVYYVPDHVKFNHQPHIQSGLDCALCHGEVQRMDRLVPVNFQMGFCIACHQQMNAQLDCWLACHN